MSVQSTAIDESPALPEPEEDFVPDEQIETGAAGSWQSWKRNPTPATMAQALRTVRPVMDKAVGRLPGASRGLMAAKAKQLSIAAIKTYDPAQGTALSTHVFNALRPLRGYADEATSAIHRTRTDNSLTRRYLTAHGELNQTLNRDPTDEELQDALGVSGKELEKMRRTAVGEAPEGDFSTSGAQEAGDPYIGLWADHVYSTLNPVSKKIFELKTGRNGHPILSSAEVAAKLGMSEVYVNRKAAEISQQILDGANALAAKKLQPEIEEGE